MARGPESCWRQHISAPQDFQIELYSDPGDDELSTAEEELIDEVFDEHGGKNRWDLVRYTHDLPEWQDPGGSSIPIAYRDILKAAGKTEAEIVAALHEAEGRFRARIASENRASG
jgi:hypothetical protein